MNSDYGQEPLRLEKTQQKENFMAAAQPTKRYAYSAETGLHTVIILAGLHAAADVFNRNSCFGALFRHCS